MCDFNCFLLFLLISFDVQDVVIDVHDFRVCSRTHKNQWKMKGFIPQLGLALGFLLILCKGIGDRLVAGRRVPRVPRRGSSSFVVFAWFRARWGSSGFPGRVPQGSPELGFLGLGVALVVSMSRPRFPQLSIA